MTNIQLEMNFYTVAKQYVVLVLFQNEQGERASICYYPKTRKEALHKLHALENQYSVTGVVNE